MINAPRRKVMNCHVVEEKFSGIAELTADQLDEVSGGFVPLLFAAAVIATGGTFAFTIGIFDGIAEKYGK
jgi:lactobin A/cerein 7B family class IIb bacteriocin